MEMTQVPTVTRDEILAIVDYVMDAMVSDDKYLLEALSDLPEQRQEAIMAWLREECSTDDLSIVLNRDYLPHQASQEDRAYRN